MVSSSERVKRYRNKRKALHEGGVTLEKEGVTSPVTKGVTLSDGQVWYPDKKVKEEADRLFRSRIEYMGNLRGDLKARKERADGYAKWRVGKGSMGNVEPLKVG